MKVIVLTINQYKEKDGIVTAISENGLVTFLARGIKDPKSKNAAINNALSIVDVVLEDGNFKHPVLRSSKTLFNPLKAEMDTKYLGTLMLMNEAILFLFQDDEKYQLFSALEEGLVTLRRNDDWIKVLLIYLANVVRIGGFALEVNRCVLCGNRKHIVTFSFPDGGFICEDCYQEDMGHDLSKNQMLILRNVFNARSYDLLCDTYNAEDGLVVLKKLLNYIQEAFGYEFKNLRLLFN